MGRAIVSDFAARGLSSVETDPRRVKEAAAFFRAKALEFPPVLLESDRDTESDLLGVVIDAALAHDVLSLTVLRDGTVSLQSTGGFACLGRINDPNVCGKCADLLQYAERFLTTAVPAEDLGKPDQSEVRFYFLTNDGPLLAQSTVEDLSRIEERLGVLYFAAQRVVAVVEQLFAVRANGKKQADSRSGHAVSSDIGIVEQIDGDSQCSSAGNAAPPWRT